MSTISQGERGRDAMKILKGLGFSDDIGRNTQFVMNSVRGISEDCVLAINFLGVSVDLHRAVDLRSKDADLA